MFCSTTLCRQVALWANKGPGGSTHLRMTQCIPRPHKCAESQNPKPSKTLGRQRFLFGPCTAMQSSEPVPRNLHMVSSHIALHVFCPHKSAELVARRRAQDSKRQCATVEPPDASQPADATRYANPIPAHAT